jgi:hypothetical protein
VLSQGSTSFFWMLRGQSTGLHEDCRGSNLNASQYLVLGYWSPTPAAGKERTQACMQIAEQFPRQLAFFAPKNGMKIARNLPAIGRPRVAYGHRVSGVLRRGEPLARSRTS